MPIRYIKEDGFHFYIVTEKGVKYARPKNRARLINTTERTWSIECDGWVYVYDENAHLIQTRRYI